MLKVLFFFGIVAVNGQIAQQQGNNTLIYIVCNDLFVVLYALQKAPWNSVRLTMKEFLR